jgi:hypothetical protein
MIIIYDRASAALALARDLGPHMRDELNAELTLLTSGEHDLTACTTVLLVEAGDTEADVAREAGMPDRLDGWDLLTLREDFFRMVITYGAEAATIILTPDTDGIDPALLDLCRRGLNV